MIWTKIEDMKLIEKFHSMDNRLVDVVSYDEYLEFREEERSLKTNGGKETKEFLSKRERIIKCRIEFDTEEEFIVFCESRGSQRVTEECKHELEHAEICKKYELSPKLGFHKLTDKNGVFFYLPFTAWTFEGTNYTKEERIRIEKEIIENVTTKSDGDKLDLLATEKILKNKD